MLEIDELIERYKSGPDTLQQVCSKIADNQWDLQPIEGQWSFRELLCHLSDAELIYADRMKRVLAEDNPTLFDADPDVHVPALTSVSRQPQTELQVISAVRAQVSAILSACDIEDFQRTGVHSTDGPVTLETLLERITGHVPHHIAFMEQKLSALAS